MLDCIVIGSGYAGCSASIYLSMAKKRHFLFTGELLGGLIATTSTVANYPGLNNISGIKMANLLIEHASYYQECSLIYDIVTHIEKNKKSQTFIVHTEKGNSYESHSIIVATGSSHRKLPLADVNGVVYCAVCDGAFFSNKTVAVVGGGNSAFEAICYLAPIAQKVYLIHRKDSYRAFQTLINQAQKYQNIHFMPKNEIDSYIVHDEKLKGVELISGEKIECEGLFVSIGHYPNTAFLKDFISMNEEGYIIVDHNMQSNIKNIFAAGDVIDNPWRQGVVAASDGSKAALSLIKQLNTL